MIKLFFQELQEENRHLNKKRSKIQKWWDQLFQRNREFLDTEYSLNEMRNYLQPYISVKDEKFDD